MTKLKNRNCDKTQKLKWSQLKNARFLNTRANIMNLQFGNTKCKKMLIGKKHNEDICPTLFVDSWKEEVCKRDNIKELYDTYIGKTNFYLQKKRNTTNH